MRQKLRRERTLNILAIQGQQESFVVGQKVGRGSTVPGRAG